MKSFKMILNSLKKDPNLKPLTNEEIKQLRGIMLTAFDDICRVCQKYSITVMLIGGSALGAFRHRGFIPWDDDLDIAMPRSDYIKFKDIFDKELGDKYILSAPNYKGNAKSRFPQICIKNTRCVSFGEDSEPDMNQIKLDLFIIENIPNNVFHRCIKGVLCSALMYAASTSNVYQSGNNALKAYMSKDIEGKKYYKRMVRIGRGFSFFNVQKWFDLIDMACQYNHSSVFMGIPTGRGHYFGETLKRSAFLPVSEGIFEGRKVKLPGDPQAYLKNLYGDDYMTIPPIEKREQHFIYEICFDTTRDKRDQS